MVYIQEGPDDGARVFDILAQVGCFINDLSASKVTNGCGYAVWGVASERSKRIAEPIKCGTIYCIAVMKTPASVC